MPSPRPTATPDIASTSTSDPTSTPTPAPTPESTETGTENATTSAAAAASTEAATAAGVPAEDESSRDTLDTGNTLDGDNKPSTSGQQGRCATPVVPDPGTPGSSCAFRLRQELHEIRTNPPPNCSADMYMDKLLHWTATVIGPTGSVYEGGHFNLDIRFPLNYPFRPPRIHFTTFIYHCNVDSVGAICLDVLNERWSPVMNVSKVLLSIWLLLGECNAEDPLVACIADQYKNNRQEHDKVARFWTKRFAIPKEAKEPKDPKEPNESKGLPEPKDAEQNNNNGENT